MDKEIKNIPQICYVCTKSGTIKSFFLLQLKFLAANGFGVTVICSMDEDLKEILGSDIKYIPVEIPRGIHPFTTIKAIQGLVKVFTQEKFDLVQYSTPNAAFCASIASVWCGIRCRNYHLMGFRYLGASGLGRWILKQIEKFVCALSTSIECVSYSNMKLGLEERLFTKDKVSVIGNGSSGGVDLTRFDYNQKKKWRIETREALGYETKDFVYGYIGRITRDKGINEIIEAFLNLNDDSKLILIGRMDGENTLDRELLQKALNNANILFHERVNDIEKYYAAIDVLLLPSYREGFGNVIIEAGAMGVPAIVSNIPGPIDTIDINKTAFVVSPKDPEALKEMMIKVKNCDYYQMGLDALQFVSGKFDSAELVKKILERKKMLLKL